MDVEGLADGVGIGELEEFAWGGGLGLEVDGHEFHAWSHVEEFAAISAPVGVGAAGGGDTPFVAAIGVALDVDLLGAGFVRGLGDPFGIGFGVETGRCFIRAGLEDGAGAGGIRLAIGGDGQDPDIALRFGGDLTVENGAAVARPVVGPLQVGGVEETERITGGGDGL